MANQRCLGVIRKVTRSQENEYCVEVCVYELVPTLKWKQNFIYTTDMSGIVDLLEETGLVPHIFAIGDLAGVICDVTEPSVPIADGGSWIVAPLRTHGVRMADIK